MRCARAGPIRLAGRLGTLVRRAWFLSARIHKLRRGARRGLRMMYVALRAGLIIVIYWAAILKDRWELWRALECRLRLLPGLRELPAQL